MTGLGSSSSFLDSKICFGILSFGTELFCEEPPAGEVCWLRLAGDAGDVGDADGEELPTTLGLAFLLGMGIGDAAVAFLSAIFDIWKQLNKILMGTKKKNKPKLLFFFFFFFFLFI